MNHPLRNGRSTVRSGFAVAALLVLAAARPPAQGPVDYTKYHTYDELTSELQQLVRAHRDIARLVSIGESQGGRSVWAVEIANRSGIPVDQRSALFVAANLEGDQVIGSELALFTVEWLLTQYESNADVRQRVDEQAFFIVPRVNPDGAEAMFDTPRKGRRSNLRPYDDDSDGRTDEDPPEDLNGDGVVTVMRVRDASGPYMIHPADGRLLKRADAAQGESGGWAVYWEGTDNDGDGFYNEDDVGGVDLNRNFQHEYPYYVADAGPHMVSEPETRALMDYIIAHRGVAAMLVFGGSDNLITAPDSRGALGAPAGISLLEFANVSNGGARSVGVMSTGGGRGFFGFGRGGGRGGGRGAAIPTTGSGRGATPPATTVATADQEYFRTISEKYGELTGIRRAAVTRAPAGAFFEYGYYQFGVPSFSTPGWGIESGAAAEAAPQRGAGGQAAGQRGVAPGGARGARPGGQAGAGDDNDLRLLQWLEAEEIDGFVDWAAYDHPQLGAVEIGGFKPYAVTNPPVAEIADLGASHAEFALYLSTLFPRVRIAETSVTAHGGGVFHIEAEIENAGYLPTASAQGVRSRSVQPVMVQLGVDPEDIITGDNKTNFINALAGSGTRQAFQWVIRGQSGARVELKVRSQKSGSESVTLTLR